MDLYQLRFSELLPNVYFPDLPTLSTPEGIFIAFVTLTWAIYLWESYLRYRQYSVAKTMTSMPMELVGIMDQETYLKSRAYHMEKNAFGFVSSLWEQMFQTVVLTCNGLPFLWDLSGRITAHFGYGSEHEITQTVVFSLMGSLINSLIDLPFSIYYTFVLEEKYGFNKETPLFFIKDRIKKLIVMEALVLPVLACVVQIVKSGGDFFFIYVWLFCVFASLALVTVWADYIAPLLDKFTPLEEGPLKTEIERLASSIGFPLKKLFIVEGSKRSAHSNAYYYGFFNNKRIVLFDTLLADYSSPKSEENKNESESKDADEQPKSSNKKGCSNDEIIAVLAHELGHWKLSHVLKNLILSQVNMFILFAVFSLLFKNQILYTAFGFEHEQPVIVGLILILQYIFSPYNELISFLMTSLNRRFEFQADSFAKILNKAADLRSALIKLNKDNLTFPIYDWLYTAWHHSHPTLLQRIQALGKID